MVLVTFDEVKFVDVACCVEKVRELESSALLHLSDLATDPSEILHKHFSRPRNNDQSLLGHKLILFFILLA